MIMDSVLGRRSVSWQSVIFLLGLVGVVRGALATAEVSGHTAVGTAAYWTCMPAALALDRVIEAARKRLKPRAAAWFDPRMISALIGSTGLFIAAMTDGVPVQGLLVLGVVYLLAVVLPMRRAVRLATASPATANASGSRTAAKPDSGTVRSYGAASESVYTKRASRLRSGRRTSVRQRQRRSRQRT
jgi:hypothetical protein